MDVLKRLFECGIVPVVVIENADDAVPTAHALLAGGIDVMEITFRTAAAEAAIKAVAAEVPEMLVGAGTVVTLEQGKKAVAAGAKFIVSPGFDEELVRWLVDNGIPTTPGCVTPTEITAALKLGLKVLKFFPANVYGGLSALKALSGPFGGVKFIPTGGIAADNLEEYAKSPYVHAVGGSWVCSKADIAAHEFEKITALSAEAVQKLHGFEIGHVGINSTDENVATATADEFKGSFGFNAKVGNSSIFASPFVEIMKTKYFGERGHIGFKTNSVERAAAMLARRGFTLKQDTVKMKNGRMDFAYLENEIGGFALHLNQK